MISAKEEVLKELKARKYELEKELSSMVLAGFSNNSMEYKIIYSFLDRINTLITAVENAIFDVPSKDEIWKEANKITVAFSRERFLAGCQYILTYKKPESNGKD